MDGNYISHGILPSAPPAEMICGSEEAVEISAHDQLKVDQGYPPRAGDLPKDNIIQCQCHIGTTPDGPEVRTHGPDPYRSCVIRTILFIIAGVTCVVVVILSVFGVLVFMNHAKQNKSLSRY